MRYLILVTAVWLFLSCTNGNNSSSTSADSTTGPERLKADDLPEQVHPINKAQFYIWEVNADQKTMKLNPLLQNEYFNVDTLIMGINEQYPKIGLEKKRIGHDTLYAHLKNATYLTEQMGSLGAEQYLAQAVLNLTSGNGIKYVRIDFAEGSHAAPDVWSRESFSSYKEVD